MVRKSVRAILDKATQLKYNVIIESIFRTIDSRLGNINNLQNVINKELGILKIAEKSIGNSFSK